MLDEFLIAMSSISLPIVLVIVPALLYMKSKKKFLLYIVCISLTTLIVYGIKFLLNVPRPESASIAMLTPRFPSGHAAMSFVLVGYFQRLKYRLPLLLFAGLTAYSRIFLNVHHLVDVVVGGLIGFLVPTLVLLKEERLKEIFVSYSSRGR